MICPPEEGLWAPAGYLRFFEVLDGMRIEGVFITGSGNLERPKEGLQPTGLCGPSQSNLP